MPVVVNQVDLIKAAEAVRKYKTVSAAARHLNLPRSTVQVRLDILKNQDNKKSPSNKDKEPKFEQVSTENSIVIDSVSDRIKTLNDALKYGKVDAEVWMVEKYTINSWEVSMKLSNDQVITKPLWQVKVWLKRIIEKAISEAVEKLIEKMKKYAPKYNSKISKKALSNPHMLEIALFDAHFGKLAMEEETGEECSLASTRKIYLLAVEKLLAMSSSFNIDSIVFPIGQDFFHINNAQNTTSHGTQQSVDKTLYKIFDVGLDAVKEAIDKCLMVAPVKVLWVPGNHDYDTSWFMAKCLEAHYHNCIDVIIDATPKSRKYCKYGTSLIGFTHGDEESHRDLPTIMASEVPEMWANSTARHWHLGHYHKRKETVHNAADTFNGVEVRVLPSLSGTDAWHYRKGYTKNRSGRAAEAYLWCQKTGYVAHYNAYVN